MLSINATQMKQIVDSLKSTTVSKLAKVLVEKDFSNYLKVNQLEEYHSDSDADGVATEIMTIAVNYGITKEKDIYHYLLLCIEFGHTFDQEHLWANTILNNETVANGSSKILLLEIEAEQQRVVLESK